MTAAKRWLHRFSWLVVLATSALIFIGAMVTSKDAGLAVPDWPLSFGSLNPPNWWEVEPVFWEHGHRLAGAVIGMLTIGLVISTWIAYPKHWLRWFSLGLLLLVIAQGVIGGIRVTHTSTELAILHGCVAQTFYSLLAFFIAAISPHQPARLFDRGTPGFSSLKWASVALVGAVFLQLIIGAVMRHYKAGLAILGFPLSNGKWIPEFTNYGVVVHFIHRVWAVVVLLLLLHCFTVVLRRFSAHRDLVRPAWLLALLVLLQIGLGAATVLSFRQPLWTSAHVLNGALILAVSVYFAVRIRAMEKRTNPGEDAEVSLPPMAPKAA